MLLLEMEWECEGVVVMLCLQHVHRRKGQHPPSPKRDETKHQQLLLWVQPRRWQWTRCVRDASWQSVWSFPILCTRQVLWCVVISFSWQETPNSVAKNMTKRRDTRVDSARFIWEDLCKRLCARSPWQDLYRSFCVRISVEGPLQETSSLSLRQDLCDRELPRSLYQVPIGDPLARSLNHTSRQPDLCERSLSKTAVGDPCTRFLYKLSIRVLSHARPLQNISSQDLCKRPLCKRSLCKRSLCTITRFPKKISSEDLRARSPEEISAQEICKISVHGLYRTSLGKISP